MEPLTTTASPAQPPMWLTTSTARPKWRINLSEMRLLTSVLTRLNAWARPTDEVKTICVVVQVQYPHLDLQDEAGAVLERHQQLHAHALRVC
ncbi:hypothetical protein [Hymenobacter sp. BT491]|uniref:hypothetical protein n=1 Tax=Hymenobacter sp. BT491 TaxID=2766779 RepID=UPI001653A2C0|nr:hypothetical protein [Hymenobacter sp. BT491]MBC6988986.1 hypothetical protein [Hymenobacter sp. BT491]